jgi:hypothetical protein
MTNWYDVMGRVFETFWENFMLFLPSLVAALFVFIVGWFIALASGKIISGLLYRLKFNEFFEGEKWEKAMQKAEIRINPSEFLGNVIKWVIFIIVIWMTVGILGLDQFAHFMTDVVAYLPNVIVATLIFVVAIMIGDFLSKLVIAATERSEFPYSVTAGALVKVAIWVFATFAILVQLGIARELLLIAFQGLIAFMVIAGGLSFGLGGKDSAAKFIDKMKKKIK